MSLLESVANGSASLQSLDGVCVVAHVLGEIGDERAFRPLLKMLARHGGSEDDLLGDTVAESMVSVLISLMGDDREALERMVLDAKVDDLVRDRCFRAWTYAALTGRIEREHAHGFLAEYLPRARLDRDDFGLSSWTDAVTLLRFADLTETARKYLPVRVRGRPAWEQPATTFEDFKNMLAEAEHDPDAWKDEQSFRPFDSTIAELSSWHGYSEEFRLEQAAKASRDELDRDFAELEIVDEPQTVTNPYRDVGRNDPCPCGSGKKFKKCCLN